MLKTIKQINYFIYLLLLNYLVIDTITGISLHYSGPSFSIPYKVFILGLMILSISLMNSQKLLLIFISIIWLILSFFSLFFFPGNETKLIIQSYIKILSYIVFYIYIKLCKTHENRVVYYINNILIVNLTVFSINIILGALGFGYKTYEYGFGTKGFFYSGNEIFLILISLTALLIRNKNSRYVFFISVVSLIFSVLIGTKTAMMALLILICYNFLLRLNTVQKTILIFFIPLVVLLGYFIYVFSISKLPVFEFLIYNFSKNKEMTGSIFEALLSGRIMFLRENLSELKSLNSIFPLFFGGINFHNGKGSEIDLFDTLFLNGIVVVIFVLLFYLFLIIQAIQQKNKSLVIFNVLVLFISFTAGHVWTNITGGVFMIVLNIFPDIYDVYYIPNIITKYKINLKSIFRYTLNRG